MQTSGLEAGGVNSTSRRWRGDGSSTVAHCWTGPARFRARRDLGGERRNAGCGLKRAKLKALNVDEPPTKRFLAADLRVAMQAVLGKDSGLSRHKAAVADGDGRVGAMRGCDACATRRRSN